MPSLEFFPEALKSQEIKQFEAAVSFCASAAFTMNDACFIDLLLAGDQVHGFTGQPRAARLDRIHELLAEIEPSQADFAEQTILSLMDRFDETSQVVFVFLRWDTVRERLLELAERAGCRCTVVLIGEPGETSLPGDTARRTRARQGWDGLATGRSTQEARSNKFVGATRSAAPMPSAVDWEDMGIHSGRTIRVLSADEILSGQVRWL